MLRSTNIKLIKFPAIAAMLISLTLTSLTLLAEDKVINEDVLRAIQANKITDVSALKIDTKEGIVILSGSVPTEKEAITAIISAMSISGVKDVDTKNLIIQPTDRTAVESSINNLDAQNREYRQLSNNTYQDIFTTAKVKGLFAREDLHGNELGNMKLISVETKNGVVYLVGTATSPTQAQKTVDLIKTIQGVQDVQLLIDKKY